MTTTRGLLGATGLSHASRSFCPAVNLHVRLALDNPAPQRSVALVADKEDVRLLPAQIALQVMQDSTAVAHSGASQDHARSFKIVNLHRVLRCDRGSERHQIF